MEPLETILLGKMQRATPFATLCTITAQSRGIKNPALQMGRLLERWITDGLLAVI